MATTDILTAIDVQSLPKLSQDKNSPTEGLNAYIYMIVKNDKVISGQAGAELNIKASQGDVIRWRETSLSGNFDSSVMFYQFVSNGGTLLQDPQLIGGVNNGTPYTIQGIDPIYKMTGPWDSTTVTYPYHYYQSTVMAQGKVTYHWRFQVNDTHSGALVGYGSWDPFITIGN